MDDNIKNLPDELFEEKTQEQIFDENFKTKPTGYFKDSMRRLVKNKVSMVSLGLILFFIFMAIFAPLFNEFLYTQQHVAPRNLRNMPPRVPGLERFGILDGTRVVPNRRLEHVNDPEHFRQSSIIEILNERVVAGVVMVDVRVNYYDFRDANEMYFWFGSDNLGRDLFTRLFRGTRISLFIAFFSVFVNLIMGVVIGAVMGYYGDPVDMALSRVIEVLIGIPNIVLIMMFIMMFGATIPVLVMAMCITGWVPVARLTRAQFYRFKVREFVLAARTLGVKDFALIFRHIMPHSVGILITRTMLAIPLVIFTESFLAYIGLGIRAPETSIGVMLSEAQQVLLQFPYQMFFPSVVISVLMVSFNLLANGLSDALDPPKRGEV